MKCELIDCFDKLPKYAQDALVLGQKRRRDRQLPMVIYRDTDGKMILLAIVDNFSSAPFVLVELT